MNRRKSRMFKKIMVELKDIKAMLAVLVEEVLEEDEGFLDGPDYENLTKAAQHGPNTPYLGESKDRREVV